MQTFETRQTTTAYGMGRIAHEAAALETTGFRRLTEDLAPPVPLRDAVRIRVEVGVPGARPLEILLAPGAEILLGSAPGAALTVPDPTVSARHCRVAHAGAFVEVTDLGARNGVRVSGVRVSRAALSLGGSCEIGKSVLRVTPKSNAARVNEAPPLPGIVGGSMAMRQLSAAVRLCAPLHLPALVRGETGTGKDLVARALHEVSPRADRAPHP